MKYKHVTRHEDDVKRLVSVDILTLKHVELCIDRCKSMTDFQKKNKKL